MAEDELYFPDSWNKDTSNDVVSLPMSIDEDVFRLAGNIVRHTFDESEWTLDARNARHPFPYELALVLSAGIEGKLTGNELLLFQNLQETPGEWFHILFRNNYPDLELCYAPRNVCWNDTSRRYDCSTMQSHYKKCYSLERLPEGGVVALRLLSEYCPALVEELWNLPFKELPEPIKHNARVWIPPRAEAWPMARVGHKGFGIVGGQNYTLMATRGVCEK